MTTKAQKVKDFGNNNAALKNMMILDEITIMAINRPRHLPGMVTFSGPSGFGKSTAAGYVAARHQAYYVEIRSVWAKKSLLEAILKTMGIPARPTVAQMTDQVSEELAISQNPLILDEFDYAVAKEGLIDLTRDIYEQSQAPIILIGEEKLPQKLQKWERFHGRIMEWAQALPADIEDARTLNRHYAKDVTVADDLLQILVTEAKGSVRRIVTNLDRIALAARMEGIKTIGVAEWGDKPLHTAQPPRVRGF